MKSLFRIFVFTFTLAVFSLYGAQEVKAAYSQFEFAVPVETERYKYSVALIRTDNAMEYLPVEIEKGLEVTGATINPQGTKVAYVIRDKDRLIVYMCDSTGKNLKEIVSYRSDRRNIQDFIDVKFIKNGQILVMAKLIKDELSFIEHNVAKDRTRFIRKMDWKGMPFVIRDLDSFNNGTLVFKLTSHRGGSVLEQIVTTEAYNEGLTTFLEVDAPPTILDIVPILSEKQVYIVGTPTRNPTAKNTKKSLMLIKSKDDEPVNLSDDMLFLHFTISNDKKSIIWRYTPVSDKNSVKFKRYNIETGEISMIPAEANPEGQDTAGSAANPAMPPV